MRLEGKVVLVTGGTRGIGEGIVRMCAANGAGVVFTGRSEDRGAAVEASVVAAGGRARYVRADNAREADLVAAVRATVDTFGALTTLVNNAISDEVGGGRDSHVDDLDDDVFDEIMLIAVKGALWASKHAIPEMRKAGSGSIINISASSSVLAIPGRPAYQASKGALNALTRQMAVDYGKEDIRVNTIVVGFVDTGTPIMQAILGDPQRRAAFERNVCVPRLGEPADIAAGVVYLASDEAKYLTGSQLTIDGGALCRQPLPELHFDELRGSTST